MNGAGCVLQILGRHEESIPYFERALEFAPRVWAATLLANEADSLFELGDHEGGRRLLLDALDSARASDSRIATLNVLPELLALDVVDGRTEVGSDLREALMRARDMGYLVVVPGLLSGLAAVSAMQGSIHSAARLATAAEVVERHLGLNKQTMLLRLALKTALDAAEVQLSVSELRDMRAEAAALSVDEAIEIGLSLD